jgi:hypothetical protein
VTEDFFAGLSAPVVYGLACAALGKSAFLGLFCGGGLGASSIGSVFSTLRSSASGAVAGLAAGAETGRATRRGVLRSTDKLCRSTTSGALAAATGESGATRLGLGVPGNGWFTAAVACASGCRCIFKLRTRYAPLPDAVMHTASAMQAETQRGRSPSQSLAACAARTSAGRSLVNEGRGVGIGVGFAALGGVEGGAGRGEGNGAGSGSIGAAEVIGADAAAGPEDASQVAGRGTGVTARRGPDGRDGVRGPLGKGECVAGAGGELSCFSSANSRVASGRS